MKKVLSAFMALLLFFTVAAPAASAASVDTKCPIIQVRGKTGYYYDKDGSMLLMDKDGEESTDFILEKCKSLVPEFLAATVTGDFEKWAADLGDMLAEYYGDFVPDKDGVVRNGSYCDRTRERFTGEQAWQKTHDAEHGYSGDCWIYDIDFEYDVRENPMDLADELDAFIDDVLAAYDAHGVHYDKVRIRCLCVGSSVLNAYLAKYGTEKISTIMYYMSFGAGSDFFGTIYSGDVSVDAASAARYVSDRMDDGELTDTLQTVLNFFTATGSELPANILNKLYGSFKDVVMPKALLNSYGLCQCYWACIDAQHYESAKKMIFGGKEDEYAEFIAKIDDYHNNVTLKITDLLKDFDASGVPVLVVSKYFGKQIAPVNPDHDKLADGMVDTAASSFGATCGGVTKPLSDDYIAQRTAAGYGEYISPDGCIDASTCLFPEKTWFIRNMDHDENERWSENMMYDMLIRDGEYDIHTNASYPQFIVRFGYNDFAPMDAENWKATVKEEYEPDKSKSIGDFLQLLTNFFEKIMNTIKDIVAMMIAKINAFKYPAA